MTTRELAQDVLDSAYAELGEPATYQHFAGSLQPAIGVVVMPTTRDMIDQGFGQQRIRDEAMFKLRASQVSLPTIGSLITITATAEVYRIASDPHRDDPLGLEWTFGCTRQ